MLKNRLRNTAVAIFLLMSLLVVPRFCTGGELTPDDYTDPPRDLIYIYTGNPVPPEKYAGYLDVINSEAELTPESIDFRITLNDGIPPLTYTTFWTLMIDTDNSPENNCPFYPTDDVDTMYSVIYLSTTKQWKIEKDIYRPWGWELLPTEATWGMTSSWPDGKPQITLSIPTLEMPELLPKTLPWKVKTECTGTYKGDLAPDLGRYYTPLYFGELMFMEGVFQPVQVVYQHDPVLGDNMTRISSHEWIANIPMVQDKNTLLFGYPYDDRYTVHFNVTNSYFVPKTFNLTFWVENRKIHETGPFTAEPFSTIRINLTAPLPRNDSAPTPFKYESKGDSTIEVEVHPILGSEPILCNKVIVHTNVTRTQALKILYVPILLFNGTTGMRLHDPVTHAEAKAHANKATEFIEGAYPVSEYAIDYEVAWPPCAINHTEVQDAIDPPRVIEAMIMAKLTDYARMEYFGYTRIVGLVPNDASHGGSSWVATYIRNGWNGVMIPDNPEAVLVVAGRWATTAHEIGHTFGLWVYFPENSEEYSKTNPGYRAPGYWVNKLDDRDRAFCFMGRNPYKDYDTDERWVCKPDYQWLLRNLTREDPEVLLINGLISKNGTVQLFNWYHLRLGVPDIRLNTSGDLTLLFLDNKGSTAAHAGLNIAFVVKADELKGVNVTNFAFKVQYVPGTVKIRIVYKGLVVAEKEISKNSPSVNLTFPNGNEILNPRTPVTIAWNASDADGDPLTHIIEYSNNSGLTWTPITVNVRTLSSIWNISELLPGKTYMIRVTATDGINIGEDSSDNVFSITFREDINSDGKVNIMDVSIVAIAFRSTPADPKWNPDADIDANGVINILDLTKIALKFSKSL